MKPTIGGIVHVFADPSSNNGADIAPAVITRVWSDALVNVHVLPDAGPSRVQTSVSLHVTREEAEAAHGAMFGQMPEADRPKVPYRAFWPPREG